MSRLPSKPVKLPPITGATPRQREQSRVLEWITVQLAADPRPNPTWLRKQFNERLGRLARAIRDEERRALEPYLDHDKECPAHWINDLETRENCTCGFDEAPTPPDAESPR